LGIYGTNVSNLRPWMMARAGRRNIFRRHDFMFVPVRTRAGRKVRPPLSAKGAVREQESPLDLHFVIQKEPIGHLGWMMTVSFSKNCRSKAERNTNGNKIETMERARPMADAQASTYTRECSCVVDATPTVPTRSSCISTGLIIEPNNQRHEYLVVFV
jgi:hypothetical protein